MSALEALHECGAHFVLCRGDKQPVSVAWQKTRPKLPGVEEHAARGGSAGVIPASVGCVVVDVDEGGAAGVEALRGVSWATRLRRPGHGAAAITLGTGRKGAAKSETGSGRWTRLPAAATSGARTGL